MYFLGVLFLLSGGAISSGKTPLERTGMNAGGNGESLFP